MNAPARSTVARICALAALVGAAAVAVTLLLPDLAFSSRPAPWWVVPLIAIAFAVAEKTVFHFEFRREAISFSLSEYLLGTIPHPLPSHMHYTISGNTQAQKRGV